MKDFTWFDLYQMWQGMPTFLFPELECNPVIKVDIKTDYGTPAARHYYYDWIPKDETKDRILEIQTKCKTRGIPETLYEWNKGTLYTASLLACSKTAEDLAAVWIAAYLSDIANRDERFLFCNNFKKPMNISYEYLRNNLGAWHGNMGKKLPYVFVGHHLAVDAINKSQEFIIELAISNASLTLTHFDPVEYHFF